MTNHPNVGSSLDNFLEDEKLTIKGPSKEALLLAGQAWKRKETKHIEMNISLLTAFAHILDEHNFTNQLGAKEGK